MIEELKKKYIVKNKIIETSEVMTLQLVCEDGTVPDYHCGQCVNIYFPNLNTPEGKAYSISSSPQEKTLNITVKLVGNFSNRLCAMNLGDELVASLPYGYFFSESTTSDLVMVAAGIGITPFRSMIFDILKNNPSRNITLLYSNKTKNDIVFKNEFGQLQNVCKNFKIIYFLTHEEGVTGITEIEHGRMNANNILRGFTKTNDTEFLICGSIPFVRDLWKDLQKMGVPQSAIYTEAFFSH